jgi:hypothetical protein
MACVGFLKGRLSCFPFDPGRFYFFIHVTDDRFRMCRNNQSFVCLGATMNQIDG